MGLLIRMVLYFVAAFVAGQGWASFDSDSGTLSVNLDDIAVMLGSVGTFVMTFVVGRWAKARGGKT